MRRKARRITTGTLIYVVDIVLDDIAPPIRRRVELAADTDLEELHLVVQAAMGWEDSHLHLFELHHVTYGEPDPDGPELENEAGVRLSSLVGPGDAISYTYDFGDGWAHTITVRDVTAPEPGTAYPRLLEADRACPPEDTGGPWGYPDLLEEARRSPDDEDLAWLREFDPEDPGREHLETCLAVLAWTPLAG